MYQVITGTIKYKTAKLVKKIKCAFFVCFSVRLL